MINLYIIDDDHLIGSGFEKEFGFESKGIRVCGCATSIEQALQEIPNLLVHVLVLDLYIDNLDPVENVRLLRKLVPHIPILILTHEEDSEWKIRMFKEGVSAYILKSPNIEDMRWTFLKVATGSKIISDETLTSMTLFFNRELKPILEHNEKEILNKLRDGFSIISIAKSMYKTPSSIEKILHLTREKFKAKTNCELIAYLTRSKLI